MSNMDINSFYTERCFVRSFKEEDLDSFTGYRNNQEWMKYQGYKGLDKDEYRKGVLVPFNINKGTQLAIIEKDSGNLVGDLYISKEEKIIHIGYTISPEFSRKGFAFEVVNRFLEILVLTYKDCIIKAETDTDNIASNKLLEKLGFKFLVENEEGYVFEFNS